MGWRSFIVSCVLIVSFASCLWATSLRHHPINERQSETLRKKRDGMTQEESDAANEFDNARLSILSRHRDQKLKAKKQILATKEVFGLVNNEATENEIARKMNKLQKAGISTM